MHTARSLDLLIALFKVFHFLFSNAHLVRFFIYIPLFVFFNTNFPFNLIRFIHSLSFSLLRIFFFRLWRVKSFASSNFIKLSSHTESGNGEKRNVGSLKSSRVHGSTKVKRDISNYDTIPDEAESVAPVYQTEPLSYDELYETMNELYPNYDNLNIEGIQNEKRFLGEFQLHKLIYAILIFTPSTRSNTQTQNIRREKSLRIFFISEF